MVSIFITAISGSVSFVSSLLGIWLWIDGIKEKKKRRTAITFVVIALISISITLISISTTKTNIQGYQEYQEDLAAQQAADDRSYKLAQEYIKEGNMFEAIRQLQNISSHYELYEKSQELLSSSIIKYKNSILEKTEELSKTGKLEDAINVIKTAQFLLPDDSNLDLKLEKYTNDLSKNTVDEAIKNAKSYENLQDYKSAILIIRDAAKLYPNNQELKLKLSTYESEYVNDILNIASTYISQHKVDSAIDTLNDALSVVPQEKELKERLYQYKNITVNLSTLTYLKQSGFFNDTDITVANDGSLISNGFVFYYSGATRTYALDGKYSAIVGTYALIEECKNYNVRCVLTIDVDGKEYILPEVKAGVRPVPFDIPLLNAQNITFTLYCDMDSPKIVVGNTILYKTE